MPVCVFEPGLMHNLDELLQMIATQGGPDLQEHIEALRQALLPLQGQPVSQGLEQMDQPILLP